MMTGIPSGCMSYDMIMGWYTYFIAVGGFGEDREDMRHAHYLANFAEAHRNRKKRIMPYTVKDFLLNPLARDSIVKTSGSVGRSRAAQGFLAFKKGIMSCLKPAVGSHK